MVGDEPIIDERVNPTHEVAADFAMSNVCLADVQLQPSKEMWLFSVSFFGNKSNDSFVANQPLFAVQH